MEIAIILKISTKTLMSFFKEIESTNLKYIQKNKISYTSEHSQEKD